MTRTLTQEQLATMSKEELQAELCNRVYEASLLIEQLESTKRVNCNGHHCAQNISAFAVQQLIKSWAPEPNAATLDNELKTILD